MGTRTRLGRMLAFGGATLLVGGAGCERQVPVALGTSVGHPLLVGLEQGSELQLGSVESSPLRVKIDTVSGESAYHTTWSIGAGVCLEVTPRSGAAVTIEGSPISAEYYHLGRVLLVSVGAEGRQQFSNFVEPVVFRTVPCALPAPAGTSGPQAAGPEPAGTRLAADPPAPVRPPAE